MSLGELAKVWAPVAFAVTAIFVAGGMYFEFQGMKGEVGRLRADVDRLKASSGDVPASVVRSGDKVKLEWSADGKIGLWLGHADTPAKSAVLSTPVELKIQKVP